MVFSVECDLCMGKLIILTVQRCDGGPGPYAMLPESDGGPARRGRWHVTVTDTNKDIAVLHAVNVPCITGIWTPISDLAWAAIVPPNRCTKTSISAKPGELILFVRPWEPGEDM
jgi:hypothetical protein